MINGILTFIIYFLSFFLVFVSLGLADEESDYFMVLIYESVIFLLYLFVIYRIKIESKKYLKAVAYSIIPILITVTAFSAMSEPLRLEGGNLKNTINYLWIIIILQIIKLVVLATRYFKTISVNTD